LNVKELIFCLEAVDDKELDVRIEHDLDDENHWLQLIEVHQKGQSGYELHGECVLYSKSES
jgi:hypothetical protein